VKSFFHNRFGGCVTLLVLPLALCRAPADVAVAGRALAPATFSEAPQLGDLVATGELPPVRERLPKSPMVVKPHEEVGRYGGVWRRAHLGPLDAYGATYVMKETLLQYSVDYEKIVPNVCKAYEWSDNYKTITFYLREGMKWSDGAPFTADDFLFWYEDVALNKKLSPVPPPLFKRGGELLKMVRVDEHTFRIKFARPYASFVDYLAGLWNPTLYMPKHYCRQFHPKYAPPDRIEKMRQEGGFSHWTDQFRHKTYYVRNPEAPTIQAWLLRDRLSSQVQRWQRNPYYWKVDPEGAQLPYIDAVHFKLVSDAQAVLLQALAGEIDMQMRRIGGINVVGIENYPLLMENRAKGGYRIICRDIFRLNKFAIYFNFTHRDRELRGLFILPARPGLLLLFEAGLQGLALALKLLFQPIHVRLRFQFFEAR